MSVLIVILAGCATPLPPKPTSAPEPRIPTITWQWVDEDLLAASRDARSDSQDFAVGLLDSWLKRVRNLTDTRFVPWYTDFGTHQWLSIKRGWYGLNGSDDGRSPEERMAALALGGVAGALISVGVSGWQAFEHEKKRPELERALRTSLAKALDELHARLLNDPNRSLMAVVENIADQVENGLIHGRSDQRIRGLGLQ